MQMPAMHPQPDAETLAVSNAIVAALGQDLSALLWHGSRARGEANEESDYDMIVIVRRKTDDTLERLGGVFAGRPAWSAYIKTEEELRQYPMTGRLQFHHGLVVLHGSFTPPPVTREGLLEDLRSTATNLSHEARYRIVHGAAKREAAPDRRAWAARTARWMYYQTKSAVMAMKVRELLASGRYPLTREHLRQRLSDPAELALLDAVERWPALRPSFEADVTPLCRLIDAFATSLVQWLAQAHPRRAGQRLPPGP